MRLPRLAFILALAACKPTVDIAPPAVASASPAFGPLSGGTIVMLTGSNFLANAAPPDHVLVGGVESPLASVIDDHTLQFVLPPGTHTGDAAIAVFNQNGDGSAAGIFHYSDEPTISSISPPRVLFSSSTTTLTVTGTGFQDENAGRPQILVDGQPALDVQVLSDTQLTFTARPSTPLTRPTIAIANARGSGSLANAYLSVPSTNPGLLLFPNDGRTFFLFFDPIGGTTVSVPLLVQSGGQHLRAVAVQPDGTYVALRSDGQIGVIDFRTQTLVTPRALEDRFPAAAELGNQLFAISATKSGLVTIDAATGSATRVGSAQLPTQNGGTAIAADGSGRLWYGGAVPGQGDGFLELDPATGSGSNFVSFAPDRHISEMRFLENVLYGSCDGDVVQFDPATGSNTIVHSFGTTITAMEALP